MGNQYQLSENWENQRLAQLYQYNILDSISEAGYNDIARLASHICEAPLAFITFIDADRQWIKSSVGIEVSETPRVHSICHYAIQHPGELMIVEDICKDSRFYNNPLITGNPYFAFYAGMPLTNMHGYAIGTICVLDDKPRTLTAWQKKALKLFSIQLMHMLEMRRINYEYESLQAKLLNNHPAADQHVRHVTSQIRQSLKDVINGKSQPEGCCRTEAGEVSSGNGTMEKIEIDIKALIEKILSHDPEES